MNFSKSSVLITGGTGSLGKALVAKLLSESQSQRIVIFSRDELKQSELRNYFKNDPRLRWFIGDIRDRDRLNRALYGIDFVIHTAALKQVDTGEYNPTEFISTNIYGSENLISASIEMGIKKVIALSTDKASSPINLYGATKLTADKLFISANNYSQARGCAFSVVRYGNVMGSRGSVIPYFQELIRKQESLPITNFNMTRFWITIDQAVNFVLKSFELMEGGELFVPRIPSLKITDIVKALDPKAKMHEVGIRPGEKMHEEMISEDDFRRTTYLQQENRYVVNPISADWGYLGKKGVSIEKIGAYRSDTNDLWLTQEELRSMIAQHNF